MLQGNDKGIMDVEDGPGSQDSIRGEELINRSIRYIAICTQSCTSYP